MLRLPALLAVLCLGAVSTGAQSAIAITVDLATLTVAAVVADRFLLTTNFQDAGTAQVWQLTAANSIARLPDLRLSGTSFGVTLPASSAPPSPPTNLRITRNGGGLRPAL